MMAARSDPALKILRPLHLTKMIARREARREEARSDPRNPK